MKLDILMSCMHQTDDALIHQSKITGSAVVVNQCDWEGFTQYGKAAVYDTKERGLTRSRNMAIAKSDADICLLCDDDEEFVVDYEQNILAAYERLPQADVIIFKMVNRPASFSDKVQELKFPKTMKVSSWQISFRRESLLRAGVRFDERMGAGTGNGAEEELKFLTDCRKAGLRIFYVPYAIASVAQAESTWFAGFNEKFFRDRGNTTRYILGLPLSVIYAFYYVIRKRNMYRKNIGTFAALKATFGGIRENRLTKLSKNKGKL
jgi:glycosyltransferase involved in cell wall biosynthesis